MRLNRRTRILVTLSVIAALNITPHFVSLRAAQSGRPSGSANHGDDPCDQLPDPPGKALGIDKKCPAGGSSSGVAKGDFNGDGFADLAIGEPGATVLGFASAGDVIVIYGSANGLTTNTPGIPGRQLWYESRVPGSPGANNLFGSALASGDFNNDGYSDLAIGIPGKNINYQGTTYSHWGRVVVIYGSPNGLTVDDNTVPAAQTFDFTQHFNLRDGHAAAGANLGQALTWGDFNGDGAGDLAIGAPLYTLDRGFLAVTANEGGAVWVLYGRPKDARTLGGLTTTSNVLMQVDDLGVEIAMTGDHFGKALTAGDFDSSGYFDLVIGVPDKNIDGVGPTGGQVFVLSGTSAGLDLTPFNWLLTFHQFRDEFGAALAVGDFNGDSHPDLAIGEPANGGFVVVRYSTSTGLPNDIVLDSTDQEWDEGKLGSTRLSGDRFGASLAAGDFNGDGKFDLAIGVPLRDVGGFSNAGEVRVIYGSASSGLGSSVRTPQVIHGLTSIQAGARLGSSLTAWNFGKNECSPLSCLPQLQLRTADLAIGIPFQIVDGLSGAGAVYVQYGSVANSGLSTNGAAVITASSIGLGALQGAHFGSTLY